MWNETSNPQSRSLGTNILLFSIYIDCIAMLVNFSLLIIFIHRLRSMEQSRRSTSHRIGLYHTMNTYIHLIGILITIFLMELRIFYKDFYLKDQSSSLSSWDCYLLSHLFSFFAGGVYGSCFLHAIFRYCRIMHSNRRLQNPTCHFLLILIHWFLLNLLLFPTLFRSNYIPVEHLCFIPIDDRYTTAYLALIITIIPVSGTTIFYIKIIRFMKHRRERKRLKNDAFTIRRIFFLIFTIFQTSSAGIFLWISTFFQENLHQLFYRLFLLLIILCMFIVSIGLLFVSPQLRQILKSNNWRYSKTHSISLRRFDEGTSSKGAQSVQHELQHIDRNSSVDCR